MAHEVKTSAAVRHALKQVFAPDANVLGVLIEADIGPISFGFCTEMTRLLRTENLSVSRLLGTDNRNGYDIVKNCRRPFLCSGDICRACTCARFVVLTGAHSLQPGVLQRYSKLIQEYSNGNQDWTSLPDSGWTWRG